LQDEPCWTKDGLLVLSDKVATNQEVKEVAVLPNAGEIETRPSAGGFEGGDVVA
jgi:hypothetical protein